jgi:hypothetical protein
VNYVNVQNSVFDFFLHLCISTVLHFFVITAIEIGKNIKQITLSKVACMSETYCYLGCKLLTFIKSPI